MSDVGFLVVGDWCDRCGDTNYDENTLVCFTCTYPDKERGYLDSREEARAAEGRPLGRLGDSGPLVAAITHADVDEYWPEEPRSEVH